MTRLFDYWEKGEPLELWTRRLRLDALFALVFFVVMCDRFTENPIHETLGTVIGLVALLHALLNRRWYKRRREKLTGRATRRTPDAWRMDLAYRSAHVALSLWCFLAAAVHAGLHAGIVAGKLAPWTKKLEERIGLWGVRITGLVVLALLLWRTTVAYVARDVPYALVAETSYLYVERGEFALLLPLDLLIAFLAVASLVYALDQTLSRRPS